MCCESYSKIRLNTVASHIPKILQNGNVLVLCCKDGKVLKVDFKLQMAMISILKTIYHPVNGILKGIFLIFVRQFAIFVNIRLSQWCTEPSDSAESHLEVRPNHSVRPNLISIYCTEPRFGRTESPISKTEQFGRNMTSVPNLYRTF